MVVAVLLERETDVCVCACLCARACVYVRTHLIHVHTCARRHASHVPISTTWCSVPSSQITEIVVSGMLMDTDPVDTMLTNYFEKLENRPVQ